MAYPNKIKGSGSMEQNLEIFTWWKAAILAENAEEGFDNAFYSKTGQYFPSFPFNRATIYNFCELRWSTTYSSPTTIAGWTRSRVQRWGKIKSFELALFGSVGNGGDLSATTLPKYNGNDQGRYGINGWTKCSLTYLRYALTRFISYGDCIIEDEDEGSGEPGDVVNYFSYKFTRVKTYDNFEDCGYGSQRVTKYKSTISIVNSEGIEVQTHPDYTFSFNRDFSPITITDGTSSITTEEYYMSDCTGILYLNLRLTEPTPLPLYGSQQPSN